MIRKALIGAAFSLLALVVLLYLVASPPGFMLPLIQPVRMLLVSVATGAVSRSLNGTLEIGAVDGSLLSAPIVRGVSLKDARGEQILHLDTLSLRYRLSDLFLGRLQIQELLIARPRLRLAWDEHDHSNLTDVFPPDPTEAGTVANDAGLPISILLEHVSIRSGAVVLEHPSFPGAREVDGLELDLRGEMGEGGFHLEVQRAVAQAKPAAVSLEALQGVLSMTGKRMQLDGWLLHTGASRIRLQGVVPVGDEPASLRLDLARLDVGELGRLVDEQSLRGEVHGFAQAGGPAEMLELDARFTAGVGEILISGVLETGGGIPHYRGEVQLAKLDLSALIGRDDYASDINAKLRVQGSGRSLEDLAGELDLLVEPSRVGDLTIQPSEVRITAGSERIRVQRFQVQATAFTAALEGEVDLAGRSELDYRVTLDLDQLRGLIDVNELSGKGQLHGQVRGSWPDTHIEGDLELSGFVFDDTRVRGLDLNYRIDGLGNGPKLAAKLGARAARIGGTGIEAVTADLEYAFDDHKHQAQFNARVTQSDSVETDLDGAFVSDGQHSELTLEHIGARVDDHVWHNTVPVRVAFAPDSFLFEPFRLVHGDEYIALSGGLQGGRFRDIVFRVGNLDLTFLGSIAELPILENCRGDLTAGLKGTLEAPVLSADLALRTEHHQSPPFERAGLSLSYAQGRLEGEAYVAQDAHRVLIAGLELPINLSLNETPIEQRLVDAPLRVNLAIDHPSLDVLSASVPSMPALAGTLQGRIAIAGSYSNLAIESHLDFEGIAVPGVIEGITGPLDVRGTIEPMQSPQALPQALAEDARTVFLRSLQARSSRIEMDLPEGGTSRQLALEDLVFEAGGAWDYSDGITGELRNLQTLAIISGYPDAEFALAAARLSENRLEFERISMTTGNSEIRGEGGITLDDQRLAFQWQIPRLELREFVTGLSLNIPSLVSGRFDVNGTTQDPDLSTRLEYAGSAFSADIKLGLGGDFPSYQADLRIPDLDLARFAPDMHGNFTVSANIHGVGLHEDDRKAQIKVAIDSKDFELAPELVGQLQAEVIGRSLAVETLQFQSTGFEIQAQGVLSDTQSSDFGYRLTVRDLASLQHYIPGELWVRGTLDGKVSGDQGTLDNVSTLNVEEWRYADWQGGEVSAELKVGDLLAAKKVTAYAEIIDLQSPQLASTNLRLDGTYRAMNGAFTLAVIEGPFAQSSIAGQLSTNKGLQFTLAPLHLQHDDRVWKNTGPIQIVSKATGTVTINGLNLTSMDQSIRAQGEWSPDGAIAAETRIDRLQIKPIVDALALGAKELDGLVDADLTLSGTLDQPQVRGTLDVRDGELQLAALGEGYTDIQSRLVFDGKRVEIVQLQVNSQTGTAELSGWIESAGLALGQVDLKLSADKFTVLDTPDFTAVVNSDIALRGSGEDLKAAGVLDVVRARLRYDALPSTGPSTVEPWELTVEGVFGAGEQDAATGIGEQPVRGSLPLMPFLRTDIQVKMPGNSWVRGSGTAIEIAGDVRVKKALEHPFTLTGKIRTVRGFATFFGNRFIVEKGQISFTGSEEIDPILDIEASHQVAGYKASVSITGTSSKPEVSFHSDPELAESDIISLLIFGRTSDQLSSAEQNSLGNQARRLAGQLAAGALERRVGKTLGLDTIAVDLGDDTTKTSVGVGRYISQDVFLFYERTFRDPRRGNRSGNTVGIEKRLNERQTLKATGSDLGETAVDWLWRHDY